MEVASRGPRTLAKEREAVNRNGVDAIDLADLADFYSNVGELSLDDVIRIIDRDSARLCTPISWSEAGK